MAINRPADPIYQFRIIIKHTSPHIWRRLLVHSRCSLAGFHRMIQTVMEWAGSYTYQFSIRSREYGISRDPRVERSETFSQIRLIDFGFREKERFMYEYHWGSPWADTFLWRFEIRMERALSEYTRNTPSCIGGVGVAPPEDCEGPRAFAEFRDLFSPDYFEHRLEELSASGNMEQYEEEMRDLAPWRREHFDRRAVNLKLQQMVESQAADQGERG